MIGPALSLELRTLLRSPMRMLVLVLTLGVGLFVAVQGQADVERWNGAIEAARAEQDESLEEARTCFAEDRKGPEDRPWIDLSRARWQDWYAATRLVRDPAPLAGIAFASPEAGAVAVRINRFADPHLAQGVSIENPELAAAGGLDLVTVLTLLLPLLILALGVELGGQERASGILPLLRVQSGRDRAWIVWRCVAVGMIGVATGLALAMTAAIMGSADLTSVLGLCALVLVYGAVWTGILMAVALLARSPSQGAVACGSIWIALCVLVPAVGVERTAGIAAGDFALDLTVDARDAGHALEDLDDEELIAALLQRFPNLAGEEPEDPSQAARVARQGLRIVALEERTEHREELAAALSGLIRGMSLASPAVAFTHGLERLAGRGPEATQAYRRAVVAAAADRMENYVAATWSGAPLGAEEFEQLHAETPERVEALVGLPLRELAVLGAWLLLLLAWAAAMPTGRSART